MQKSSPVDAPTAPDELAPAADDKSKANTEFFTATDDDAVALDQAIGRALDGDASAITAIKRLRKQIADRDYRRFEKGGELSPGVEALKAAAATAQMAANSGDLRRLVVARADAQRARNTVAEQFVP